MPDSTSPLQTRPPGPRRLKDRAFLLLCIGSATVAVLLLLVLLLSVIYTGGTRLSLSFITSYNSSVSPKEAGILPALIGSLWLLGICAITALPIGIGTAILLEEYQPRHPLFRRLHGFVQTNITNLAGVPSIVYGILGVTLFSTMFGFFGQMTDPAVTVGQTWLNEYYDVPGNSYFSRAESRNAEATPAYAGMVLFRDRELSDPATDARVVAEEQLLPVKQRIALDLLAIDGVLREGIEDSRTSRRGPVEIGPVRAMEIARKAFADTNLKADTEELLGITVKRLQVMDGKESRDLRTLRRDLQADLELAEMKAAGVNGLILEGSVPQRRSIKARYYIQLPFGNGVLAAGLTLMLVILPIIIVASSEAIRAVPGSVRAGCLALGGTKWQAISKVVLPAAIPGICTGAILAMSRAIGEAAPIILMGAVLITYLPDNLMSQFSAMPLQIYLWAFQPDDEFRRTAAAGIIVLLTVLLSFNALAVLIRQKSQKSY